MQPAVNRARYGTMVVLFCNGLLYSTWGVYIPLIKQKFSLSDGSLSIAMIAVATGGICTLAQAGRWIASIGSRQATVYSGLAMVVSAAAILLLPWYSALLLLLFGYGIATATNDVAANSQGALLEAKSGRSIIGSLHGSFSAGGLVGATVASAWAASGVAPLINSLLICGVSCFALLASASLLLGEAGAKDTGSGNSSTERAPSSFHRPEVKRRFIAFGSLAFAGLIVEGAIYDWAAVYMRDVVRAPAEWVGLGYAGFAIGMTIGRISGDWVRDHLSHCMVVAASCVVCVGGLAVTLGLSLPYTVVVGFFLTGIGLSNIIPIMFSSAGKLSASTGVSAAMGLALTTRIAYVGLLAGPLVIGPTAEVIGLKLALILLAIAVLVIGFGWFILTVRSGGAPWEISTDHT